MFDQTGSGLDQTGADRFDDHDDDDEGPANDADLGQPTWIELGHGFPVDGVGNDLATVADRNEAALVTSALLGLGPVVAETDTGPFTGVHAAQMVAFTEFLAGTAFAAEEREWLVDATALDRVAVRGVGRLVHGLARYGLRPLHAGRSHAYLFFAIAGAAMILRALVQGAGAP